MRTKGWFDSLLWIIISLPFPGAAWYKNADSDSQDDALTVPSPLLLPLLFFSLLPPPFLSSSFLPSLFLLIVSSRPASGELLLLLLLYPLSAPFSSLCSFFAPLLFLPPSSLLFFSITFLLLLPAPLPCLCSSSFLNAPPSSFLSFLFLVSSVGSGCIVFLPHFSESSVRRSHCYIDDL